VLISSIIFCLYHSEPQKLEASVEDPGSCLWDRILCFDITDLFIHTCIYIFLFNDPAPEYRYRMLWDKYKFALEFFCLWFVAIFYSDSFGGQLARIARRGDLPWKPGKNSRSRFKGFYKLSMLVSDWCMWVVGCSMPGLIDAFSSQSYPVVVVGKTSQCWSKYKKMSFASERRLRLAKKVVKLWWFSEELLVNYFSHRIARHPAKSN
jgi:hypothetical protein